METIKNPVEYTGTQIVHAAHIGAILLAGRRGLI